MPVDPKSKSQGKGADTGSPLVLGQSSHPAKLEDAAKKMSLSKLPGTKSYASATSSLKSSLGILAIVALILVVSFYTFEPKIAVFSSIFGGAMLAIAVIDMRHYVIPDVLSLPLIPAGLIATYWLADESGALVVLIHLAAAVLGMGIFLAIRWAYQAVRQREGLGLGDAKLAAVAGAWTGIGGLAHVMLLACVMALLVIVTTNLRNLRLVEGSLAIPFGAYLAPAIWFIWCAQMLGGVDLLP